MGETHVKKQNDTWQNHHQAKTSSKPSGQFIRKSSKKPSHINLYDETRVGDKRTKWKQAHWKIIWPSGNSAKISEHTLKKMASSSVIGPLSWGSKNFTSKPVVGIKILEEGAIPSSNSSSFFLHTIRKTSCCCAYEIIVSCVPNHVWSSSSDSGSIYH